MGRRRRMRIGYWWESRKERNHQEDLDIDGRVILKLIYEKYISFGKN
jgi:hypothetical protein